MNFDTPEYQDPYWIRAYEATTLVGLGCAAPCSSCFCTTAGCGPYHEEGLDVLLADAGDHYLARVLTEKGAKFVAAAGWKAAAEPHAADQTIAALKQASESKHRFVRADGQPEGRRNHRPAQRRLLGGGLLLVHQLRHLTFSCPTCWCFDIQDENRGKAGVRMKNWDSCMYPLFTLHGTGHNPRGTKLHRVRQRFMHKLKYFVDKYDRGIQCVGCGRCVRLCPVNIDIRRVCNMMNGFATSGAACAIE